MLQKLDQLEVRISALEKTATPSTAHKTTETRQAAPEKPEVDDEDDGVDLFASDSDEESAEAAKVREERLAAYNAKKSKSKMSAFNGVSLLFLVSFRTGTYRQVQYHFGCETVG